MPKNQTVTTFYRQAHKDRASQFSGTLEQVRDYIKNEKERVLTKNFDLEENRQYWIKVFDGYFIERVTITTEIVE